MDRQQLLPLGELEIDDWRHDLNPGIADENVETPQGGHDLSRTRVNLLLVGHVHADADRQATSGIDLGRSRNRRLQIEICDGDLGATLREDPSNVFAYSARRPCDQGNLVVKSHGVLLLTGGTPDSCS
jgi:hypothetical protein